MKQRSELYDLAVARMRKLFPRSVIVRELNRKLKPAPTAAARCQAKACPWPSVDGQWCRQHALDAVASRSTMPCALGPFITPVHGAGFEPSPPSR
jgi:hypothetical protein